MTELTQRPWYRLHCSTWAVLAAVLVALTLIVVPGFIGGGAFPGPSDYLHGWPFIYLDRFAWRDGVPLEAVELASAPNGFQFYLRGTVLGGIREVELPRPATWWKLDAREPGYPGDFPAGSAGNGPRRPVAARRTCTSPGSRTVP